MDRSVIDYYDALAPTYDSSRFANSYGRFLDAREREILDKYLSRDVSRVLDLGCGTGRLSDRADEGCDGSARSLEIARAKHPLKRFVQADIASLPYPDRSFDAVFCFHVFMHCEKPQIAAALRESARVLRPGGMFIGDVVSSWRRRLHPTRSGWHGDTALDSASFSAMACAEGLREIAMDGVLSLPVHRLPEALRAPLRKLDRLVATALPDAASYLVGVFVRE